MVLRRFPIDSMVEKWKVAVCQTRETYTPPKFIMEPENDKMMVSKRNVLFQGLIFRFHVKLQGCINFFHYFYQYFGQSLKPWKVATMESGPSSMQTEGTTSKGEVQTSLFQVSEILNPQVEGIF